MNEIKCPKCGTMFQISETNYESIVKQIRDKEFEKEITLRENQHKIDKENAIELTKVNTEKQLTEELNKKILAINELENKLSTIEELTQTKLEKKYNEELNQKNIEITELKNHDFCNP